MGVHYRHMVKTALATLERRSREHTTHAGRRRNTHGPDGSRRRAGGGVVEEEAEEADGLISHGFDVRDEKDEDDDEDDDDDEDEEDEEDEALHGFRGATSQQVGAAVLELWNGTRELDVEDWYPRVQAALRGMVRAGQVLLLDGLRFRLAEDDALFSPVTRGGTEERPGEEREGGDEAVAGSNLGGDGEGREGGGTLGGTPVAHEGATSTASVRDDGDGVGDSSEGEEATSCALSDSEGYVAHEVVEDEAEGRGGWNEGGDGWVNLVKSDDEDDEDAYDAVVGEDADLASDDAGDDDDAIDVRSSGGRDVPPGSSSSPAASLRSGGYYDAIDGWNMLTDSDADMSEDARVPSPSRPGRTRRTSNNLPVDDEDVQFLREVTAADAEDATDSALSGDTSDDDDDLYGGLHAQVSAFARTAGPDAADLERRAEVCRKIRAGVTALYPTARVEVFGSGATGLALKDADIDLVVLGIGPEASAMGGGGFSKADRADVVAALRKIEKSLRRDKVVWKAMVISTAKVPIVKMNAGAYAVDMAVGAANGLAAVGWIKQQVALFPALRPLVLVLKRLLKTHHLDDASTGGCGGYLLVSLVVSHLRQCGASGSASRPNLSTLLLGFLRRYGHDFDYTRVAVAAGRTSGVLRAKSLEVNGRRPFLLAEDPQEVGRNITGAAYRFKEVRALFRAAGEAMTAEGELTFLPEMAAPTPPPRLPQANVNVGGGGLGGRGGRGSGGRWGGGRGSAGGVARVWPPWRSGPHDGHNKEVLGHRHQLDKLRRREAKEKQVLEALHRNGLGTPRGNQRKVGGKRKETPTSGRSQGGQRKAANKKQKVGASSGKKKSPRGNQQGGGKKGKNKKAGKGGGRGGWNGE